ncbi:RNA polymerase sigma factor [Amycolatopsis sp. NBC_01307]|uniref:RNA polymerase sigma factor n=1 Tax=Amycolatopsis sp. NBC_01307 TaxID=2903561 RepID=UPI002E1389E2|nr:RNA polymerase sigma factor [Amycolatopsis sp. NBC_01307]WSK74995.1 RNA polymerase sigma factor [Amycolatopsis sp. NBC_01286]
MEQVDEERLLIRRLRSGDELAFTELVRRWTPAMLRLAVTHVPSRQVAEEVVQDTWLAVLTGLDRFEGRSSLRTWVFHILVRTAWHAGKRERRALPFTEVWREDHAPSVDPARFHPARTAGSARGWICPLPRWDLLPGERLQAADLRAVIDSAIATLPRRQQQVITARDVLGCDADEVCDLLAITANHQRVLLHRARSTVRAAIEGHLAAETEGTIS